MVNCPGCKERQRILREAQMAAVDGNYAEAQKKMHEMFEHASNDVLDRVRKLIPSVRIKGDDK